LPHISEEVFLRPSRKHRRASVAPGFW
jgi:hypothetical protein